MMVSHVDILVVLIRGAGMDAWRLEFAVAFGPVMFVYSIHKVLLLLVTCILKSLNDALPYEYSQE